MRFTGFDDRQPRSTCSFIGTTAAILAGTLAGVGSSVAGGVIGSSAAKNAAKTQAEATAHAADLQYKASQEANDLQRKEFDTVQSNLSPWLEAGKNGLSQLNTLLGPGGKLTEGYAPFDESSVKNEFDPGFAYRMKQSNDALQSWAASRGGLLSGGTGQKLIRNAQDMGSQEYQNANQRAVQKYQLGRDTFYQNQNNLYGRLSGLSGMGENAVGQLNAAGSQYATNVGNNDIATARSIGAEGEAGAAATAAGDVGASNAWTNAFSSIASALTNYGVLNSVLGSGNTLKKVQNGFVPQVPLQPIGLQPNYAR